MKPQFKAALATILVLCLTALGTGVALGADRTAGGGDFLRTEFEVLGSEASATWQAPFGDLRQIGSDGIGGGGAADSEEMKEPVESGPANTGDKVKAGLMSAVIPGAGQLYNGDKKKGFIMMGIEVGIWGAYFIFDHQGDNRMNSATDWAATYAGTRGDPRPGPSARGRPPSLPAPTPGSWSTMTAASDMPSCGPREIPPTTAAIS